LIGSTIVRRIWAETVTPRKDANRVYRIRFILIKKDLR
jgi:hypothetical protein